MGAARNGERCKGGVRCVLISPSCPRRLGSSLFYLPTQMKNGLSGLALKRQLGISQNAAWRVRRQLLWRSDYTWGVYAAEVRFDILAQAGR
jgi:hypothetical protein